MTVDKACGQSEVSPSGLSQRVGFLRSQHPVLAFLFVSPGWGRVLRKRQDSAAGCQ